MFYDKETKAHLYKFGLCTELLKLFHVRLTRCNRNIKIISLALLSVLDMCSMQAAFSERFYAVKCTPFVISYSLTLSPRSGI